MKKITKYTNNNLYIIVHVIHIDCNDDKDLSGSNIFNRNNIMKMNNINCRYKVQENERSYVLTWARSQFENQ